MTRPFLLVKRKKDDDDFIVNNADDEDDGEIENEIAVDAEKIVLVNEDNAAHVVAKPTSAVARSASAPSCDSRHVSTDCNIFGTSNLDNCNTEGCSTMLHHSC